MFFYVEFLTLCGAMYCVFVDRQPVVLEVLSFIAGATSALQEASLAVRRRDVLRRRRRVHLEPESEAFGRRTLAA